MSKTQLKKLKIKKFRALNDVELEFGDYITVICGKNSTSKSSILGIAAQIFSFEKDYVKNHPISYQQITGHTFKSRYSDHFRISEKFDLAGSMSVDIELLDGYTNHFATGNLEIANRENSPRLILRNNSAVEKGKNKSRNFTHPVIHLSLKRLYPISDRDYKVTDHEYLKKHEQEFIMLTNELLNKSSVFATGTGGTISSAVAHGNNYDHDSVSAGEDNAGQIVLAIMSFQKLKQEYSDYKGGLLLIDEADAGLFPAAQINLLNILERKCKSLNLQVVMTSHSPTLIEHVFEKSQQYRIKFKTIYLSDTYGTVKILSGISWPEICADIQTRIISISPKISLPKINVYFEDYEGYHFFSYLLNRQTIKKCINPLKKISLGCSNYIQLIQSNVKEFSEKSIICLDADVASKVKDRKFNTVILLPGQLPPDQLIFEYLYNLPANHSIWKNSLKFTRAVFTDIARELLSELSINGNSVDVKERISSYQISHNEKKKPREMFKRFYKNEQFQKFVALNDSEFNPWKNWIADNQNIYNQFLTSFLSITRKIMKRGHFVDESKLASIAVRLKKRT